MICFFNDWFNKQMTNYWRIYFLQNQIALYNCTAIFNLFVHHFFEKKKGKRWIFYNDWFNKQLRWLITEEWSIYFLQNQTALYYCTAIFNFQVYLHINDLLFWKKQVKYGYCIIIDLTNRWLITEGLIFYKIKLHCNS